MEYVLGGVLQVQKYKDNITCIFAKNNNYKLSYFLFKKKHNGVSFVNSYPEIIEMKKYLIDYTKKNLTTENVAKNIISYSLKYYI